mgnify:FL=1
MLIIVNTFSVYFNLQSELSGAYSRLIIPAVTVVTKTYIAIVTSKIIATNRISDKISFFSISAFFPLIILHARIDPFFDGSYFAAAHFGSTLRHG